MRRSLSLVASERDRLLRIAGVWHAHPLLMMSRVYSLPFSSASCGVSCLESAVDVFWRGSLVFQPAAASSVCADAMCVRGE